jgi:hypothetical protein
VKHSEIAIAAASARQVATVHHAEGRRHIIAKSILGLSGRCGLTRSEVLRLPEPLVALAVPLLGEDSIHRRLEMSHCVWIR